MRQPLGLRALILSLACAAAGACDDRHLVGDADGGAGTSASGGAGTSATAVAGTTGAMAVAGTTGAMPVAGTTGAMMPVAGTTGAMAVAGTTGSTGLAGTSGIPEDPQFPLPITARAALQRATKVLWGVASNEPMIVGAPQTNFDLTASLNLLYADPRARVGIGAFYRWWLGLDRLATTQKDATLYPQFTDDLKRSMAAETETFGVNVTLDVGPTAGQYFELMSAPYSYIDERLAAIYGVGGVVGTTLRKVSFDPAKRAGILTQPAVQALYSRPTRTSPSARGAFTLRQVLCQQIPAPPPNEPPLAPVLPANKTTRQGIEELTSQAACAACHKLIDPIGFGYEGLDAIGRVRTTDNGAPVDASGFLSDHGATFEGGTAFADAATLGNLLAVSGDSTRCFAQQWLTFALGRPLTAADQASVDFAVANWLGEGGTIRVLINSVLMSRAFLAP